MNALILMVTFGIRSGSTLYFEAALVIVPEVTEIPRATADREPSPRSRASLIRVRMNRW